MHETTSFGSIESVYYIYIWCDNWLNIYIYMGSCACTMILHRLDININIRLACFDYYMAFDLAFLLTMHVFVDPCGKFHLPLTCFQLNIWVYMQIVYKGFIILLLALVYIYIYIYILMLGLKYSFNEIYS